jgi:hypothetical protein
MNIGTHVCCIGRRLRFECFVTWFLSRSVYVRACVRVKRLHLSDNLNHWDQALVPVVTTGNCPASCPHAYLSGI